MPKSERDLAVAVASAWAPAYDNLERNPVAPCPMRSAASARAAASPRGKLYTDAEEVISGVYAPAPRQRHRRADRRDPDLAERALVLHLPPLSAAQRVDERALWRRFDAAAERVLGALLDGVVRALRDYEAMEPPELPRMADFARWMAAAESGLGWATGTMLGAYREQRADADRDAMDRDPVAALLPPLPGPRARRGVVGARDEPLRDHRHRREWM